MTGRMMNCPASAGARETRGITNPCGGPVCLPRPDDHPEPYSFLYSFLLLIGSCRMPGGNPSRSSIGARLGILASRPTRYHQPGRCGMSCRMDFASSMTHLDEQSSTLGMIKNFSELLNFCEVWKCIHRGARIEAKRLFRKILSILPCFVQKFQFSIM